jgi:nucleotide sugar dehydrogenase
MSEISVSPDNTIFNIPDEQETLKEISKIKKIIRREQQKGKKIVVVQGLGFVGAVMAAVIADCEKGGSIPYFVIGVDLPIPASFWKIKKINNGESPIQSEDPGIIPIFKRTVKEKNNFIATWISEVYSEADIIIVDINLDVKKTELGKAEDAEVNIEPFKTAIGSIGKLLKPGCLLLVETTIPPGTTEYIVKPIIQQCFLQRNVNIPDENLLIAHSYERVMPGKNYINSIKKIWRTYSAINTLSSVRTREFLSDIIETKNFPLKELKQPASSELAKILENSYRAMNIAFIYEWALFAEDIGINLFEIIDSIKVRKGTHDNMMYPGFGVGGYCLTKDTILGHWSSKQLFKRDNNLTFSMMAINVNDCMPHHTFDLLMRGMNNDISDKKISILGASYLNDIDDTRNSPTAILYDDIINAGGIPEVHDPIAKIMIQRPDIKINNDLEAVINTSSALIFVMNHKEYFTYPIELLMQKMNANACVVDAFNILNDEKIKKLKAKNFVVLGVGKGHIKNL